MPPTEFSRIRAQANSRSRPQPKFELVINLKAAKALDTGIVPAACRLGDRTRRVIAVAASMPPIEIPAIQLGVYARLRQCFLDAGLVSAKRAAGLQHQGSNLERQVVPRGP